jgi:HD-like signal output (HDOD) protein
MATGFACEELAKQVAGENPESAFLTGLFHDVAAPVIVDIVEEMEHESAVPAQSDARLHGHLDRLTTELSVRIVRSWGTPKPAVEAIELQDAKVRDRRRKPLAHLLVCAKAVAMELGMGTRPRPIDFAACRDFHFLKLDDDSKVEPAREAVMDKMLQVAKV